MKALLIDRFVKSFEELEAKDVPAPEIEGPNDVLVHITHAAITHVDGLYVQGKHQNNRRHVKPPFIAGTEFAGVVTSSSPSSSFRPGTRVYGGGLGSFAESIRVDASSIRRVPETWSNAEACAVGSSGAVSWGSLMFVAKLQKNEIVLVLGASGGLGVMAVQIAKAAGATVICVVGDEEKGRVVTESGSDHVVSYHEQDWEDKVKKLTPGGEGVDVVYDAIGAVESGLKCLKYRGRLVIVGFAARGGNIENIRANRILLKSATVHGYRFGEDGRRFAEHTKIVWDGFMKLVEGGHIKSVIYKEKYIGLESISRALHDLEAHRIWGRAILTIDGKADEQWKARL